MLLIIELHKDTESYVSMDIHPSGDPKTVDCIEMNNVVLTIKKPEIWFQKYDLF